MRQVDLRENGRAMTLIGEPVLSCSGRPVIQPQGTLRPMHSACLRRAVRDTPLAVHALAARKLLMALSSSCTPQIRPWQHTCISLPKR